MEAALIGAHGASGLEAAEQLGLGGEEDIVSLADGTVAEGLGEMALAGAAGAGDEDVGRFLDEAAGGQFLDQGPVDAGVEVKIELLDGLLRAEAGAADAQAELFLLSSGDFVLDEQGEELRVRESGLDGLAVSGLDRIEDAGEPELLEQGGEFGHGVHGVSSHWIGVVVRWKRALPV